jgi:formate-dependent nitrite reductase membrane component NrfD
MSLADRARFDAARAGERARGSAAQAPRRDTTPAVGAPGGPASWRRAVAGATVGLHRRAWADARWSSIFSRGSRYAEAPDDPDRVAEANRRGRTQQLPEHVQGPMMKPPVWTWEVPVYFWFGGMAAGASFVAMASDLAGDERAARMARKVALAALLPSPPLLIADLGRSGRFYNMLRVFKPRSPMSMGSWCLTTFGALGSAAVAADLLERPRTARALGAANAVVGGYLGSYTGVLLASTAVPVWARSRLFLGPIFVATATVTGAGAVRLALAATGGTADDSVSSSLGRVEAGAMAAELVLTELTVHRLGSLATVFETGAAARWFHRAQWLTRGGLALRVAPRPIRCGATQNISSALFMAAALCFRFAWVRAGRDSATDDEGVARMARARATRAEPELPLDVVEHR